MPRSSGENYDTILTGTTLRVYKFLVKTGKPVGPRAVQRGLGLSSPSVALFHLEKLARNGLATKESNTLSHDDGVYMADRIYLKHFLLFRRMLIPKYLFYATFSTFSLVGWIYLVVWSNENNLISSSLILLAFVYGLCVNAITGAILWYETVNVFRKESI